MKDIRQCRYIFLAGSLLLLVLWGPLMAQTPGLWETWGPGRDNPAIEVLLADTSDQQTIFAAGRGVYKTTDAGLTWKSLGFDIYRIVLMLIADDILLLGTVGIFRSTDKGITWTQANPPNYSHSTVLFMLVRNPMVFL